MSMANPCWASCSSGPWGLQTKKPVQARPSLHPLSEHRIEMETDPGKTLTPCLRLEADERAEAQRQVAWTWAALPGSHRQLQRPRGATLCPPVLHGRDCPISLELEEEREAQMASPCSSFLLPYPACIQPLPTPHWHRGKEAQSQPSVLWEAREVTSLMTSLLTVCSGPCS